ncbi:hypothetical protein ACFYNY_08580 [Streptomyces sp. NPDC006530]|uniref:hypothetical protein n=1 Tax=Streptomyces sp. NPDC006530 TaxID=3364750 RepID=UPI0036BE4EF3
MRVIRAPLTGSPPVSTVDPVLAIVHDLLWAHAVPADGLEHVTPRGADDGLHVFLFLRAASDTAALLSARTVLDRSRVPLGALGYAVTDLNR